MTKDCEKKHTRKYVMSQITAIKLELFICDRSETECRSKISSHDISNNILCIQRTNNTWITNTNPQWHNWIDITTWVQECSISTFGRKRDKMLVWFSVVMRTISTFFHRFTLLTKLRYQNVRCWSDIYTATDCILECSTPNSQYAATVCHITRTWNKTTPHPPKCPCCAPTLHIFCV
jgi:hypothetical protein